jgi:hypothetical protein
MGVFGISIRVARELSYQKPISLIGCPSCEKIERDGPSGFLVEKA